MQRDINDKRDDERTTRDVVHFKRMCGRNAGRAARFSQTVYLLLAVEPDFIMVSSWASNESMMSLPNPSRLLSSLPTCMTEEASLALPSQIAANKMKGSVKMGTIVNSE